MDPTRTQARRIMLIARDHDTKRRYDAAPHRTEWGCTIDCFPPDTTSDALTLAHQVGGLITTPSGRYAPGWMRPA